MRSTLLSIAATAALLGARWVDPPPDSDLEPDTLAAAYSNLEGIDG